MKKYATTTIEDRIAVSIPEAGRLSGLGRSTIYELMAAGKLEYSLIGKRRLVIVDSLRKLLQQNIQRGA